MAEALLPHRRIRFEYPEGMSPSWVPRNPEFAAAANCISLGMPYAEPLFIKAVRLTFDEIDDDLRERTESYIRQETGHHTQHKRFNDLINEHYPSTVRLQRGMQRSTDWVWRRSKRFRVAFAAAGETISYGVARWTEQHHARLMDGAEPVPSTLFLWHLAEEIEHKSSTYDVFEATDGSRLRYALALFLGWLSISCFTAVGTLQMLWHDRRLHKPVCWWHLVSLTLSLGFVIVPVMVVSCMPRHSPRDFADPVFLPRWLQEFDPVTQTMPIYGSELRSAPTDGPALAGGARA